MNGLKVLTLSFIYQIFTQTQTSNVPEKNYIIDKPESQVNKILKREFKEFKENQTVHILENQIPNVPGLGWLSMKNITTHRKDGCSIYPNILNDIEYRNTYWQIFRNNGSTFHLFGAYFGKIFTALQKQDKVLRGFNIMIAL